MLQESMKNELSMSKGSYTALDLFRTPYMRISTVCLAAAWCVCAALVETLSDRFTAPSVKLQWHQVYFYI